MAIEKEFQSHLDMALAEEIGIKIQTDDPARLKARYFNVQFRARKKGDFTYEALTFCFPPERDYLWIIKKEALNGHKAG